MKLPKRVRNALTTAKRLLSRKQFVPAKNYVITFKKAPLPGKLIRYGHHLLRVTSKLEGLTYMYESVKFGNRKSYIR